MDNNGSSQQYRDKVVAALQDKSTLVSLGIFIIFLIIAGVLIFTNQKKITVSDISEEAKNTQAQMDGSGSARYVVKENDTLWSIAQDRYGSGYNWVDIAEANNLSSPDMVMAGQELTMPNVEAKVPDAQATQPQGEVNGIVGSQTDKATPTVSEYTVKAGDNLWTIAQNVYGDGYAWVQIAQANAAVIANPDYIHVGTKLSMPNL